MKRYLSLTLIVILLLVAFTACGNKSGSGTDPSISHGNAQEDAPPDTFDGNSSDGNSIAPEQTTPSTGGTSESESVTLPEVDFSTTASDMFTKRDKKTDYDDTAVRIQLNGSSATADSDSVQISNSTITITEEATYLLSGSLDDGCVVVNADSSAKVHLVLDGVDINSNSSAAILVLSADKVIVTLASNHNSLSNNGTFTVIDDINVNAVLYSKDDLSLNGSGSLTINSPAGHGISCKDDLVLAGGTYTITAANHGLDANDSIRLTTSTISIEAGKDGIHAENTDDTTLGFVYIADGTYNINANDDGISAGAYLQIEDGTFDITTTSVAASTDTSGKGLKSTNSMQISSGSFTISSYDDSMHSNTDIIIHGGTYRLSSQDDGIHADAALTVNDGDINITESYEGLEALDLTVNGGNIRLIASDDGLNAAGGNDGSGFGGRGNDNFGKFQGGVFDDPAASPDTSLSVPGANEELTPDTGTNNRGNRPGKIKGDFSDFPDDFENLPSDVMPDRDMQSRPNGGFDGGGLGNKFGGGFGGGTFGGMSSSNGSITITGGTLYLRASGDGIDANGSLTITGGDITICGPNRGDTASLDYDTTATISDATFIATGATGMAQTLSSSEQGIITINVGNQNAGTTLTLTDSKGKVLLSQTPELPYSLVILSSPDLVSGESYTLTYGTTAKTITAE